jgi:MOSC domain-containing protein YiiM
MTRNFEIVSLNISELKGERKTPVDRLRLVAGNGIEGDAHAGPGHRQVSLLAVEDIDTMRQQIDWVSPGDFAENITTRGVELPSLPVGSRLRIGDAVLEISQIGKECHNGCAIMQQTGDCVMPRRGVFTRVLESGEITNESTGSYDF